ncbi:unnamed protein product [Ixodes hexagonus]
MKCNGAPSVDKAAGPEAQPPVAPVGPPALEECCPAVPKGAAVAPKEEGLSPVAGAGATVEANPGTPTVVNGGGLPGRPPSLPDGPGSVPMLSDNPSEGSVTNNKEHTPPMAPLGPQQQQQQQQQLQQQHLQQQQHQHQQHQQHQLHQQQQHQHHHHVGGALTMGGNANPGPHHHLEPHAGCNPLGGGGGNLPQSLASNVAPLGGSGGVAPLRCQLPPQGGAGGGGLEAQYMQQQSQIFVFTTGLANQAAEAVLTGQCPSIIAYHCAQPGTKRFLEKHPLKIQQFNKQNPAAWLNSLAQMKQRGAVVPPAAGGAGAALKGMPSQPFGPPFCGGGPPHHACGGAPHPGWQGHPQGHPQGHHPQDLWGAPYGAGGVPRGAQAAMGGRGPPQPHQGCGGGPPNGGCFPPTGAYQGMPMGCGAGAGGGNPAQMGAVVGAGRAGVKVPDENLTPQQRQHREEQLAMIRKMHQLLFPDQHGVGGGGGPGPGGGVNPGPPQQQQPGPGRARPGPDQFGPCLDHQHEGGPPQQHFAGGQFLNQQQQNFGVPHPASCGSPALQSFSPSVRPGTSPTHSAYGGSSPGGGAGSSSRPQPSRSPASGASPRLQQGPPPPYGARGALASPHPPPSPSPRPSGGLPSPADSTRSFPHPAAGRLANPSPGGGGGGGGSVQTTPLSSPKPCGGPSSVGRAPATPTTPGGSAVPSPSSGGGKKRAATPLGQEGGEFGPGVGGTPTGGELRGFLLCESCKDKNQRNKLVARHCILQIRNAQSQITTTEHSSGNVPKQEPGLMPVPSPQQIQYLGSLEGQELTIQKQANMGVPEGSLGPMPQQGMPMGPHGGGPMGPQGPMGPHGGPMHPMHQGHPGQQGMLQGLSHPSEIPPLDMGPNLTSENSQGSYQSSCSSGMEGTAPRNMGGGGPPLEGGGPRFPSPPVPFDGRFAAAGMAPHPQEAFGGYMDPRCRPGGGGMNIVGPDADHFPHQGGPFPGGPQHHHPVGGATGAAAGLRRPAHVPPAAQWRVWGGRAAPRRPTYRACRR